MLLSRGRKDTPRAIQLQVGAPLRGWRPPSGKFWEFPSSLGDFLCIPTLNTGQLNPLFHTFAEFRLIVNRIVARQSTDWLAANAQFFLNPSCADRNYSLPL